MRITTANHRRARATAALVAAATLGLAGCAEDNEPAADAGTTMNEPAAENTASAAADDAASEDAPEDEGDGVSVESITEGEIYGGEFREDAESFEGEQVTVNAEIAEVISPNAFSIGGLEEADVEPMLVIHQDEMSGLEQGMPVVVTGVVHKAYEVSVAEGQTGLQLDEVTFEEWGSQPYIEADTVGELRAEN